MCFSGRAGVVRPRFDSDNFRHIHIRVCNANIVLITQGLCSSVSV